MEIMSFTKKNQRNQNNNPSFNYQNEDAILKVIAFLFSPNEEEISLTINALGLPRGAPEAMAEIFLNVQRLYSKDSGRRIRHESLHLTFDDAMDKKGQNRALEIFFHFALFYYYHGFQTVYSVHQTQEGFHAHYAINTVSFCDGHKYHGNDALLHYQENYAACLIESITQKPAHPVQKITWEEFEYSDFLAIPEGLIHASLANP